MTAQNHFALRARQWRLSDIRRPLDGDLWGKGLMAIDSEIFEGELPGLATALAASAPAIGLRENHNFAAGSEPAVIGPFAAYSADPRAFLEQGEAEQSGWRGLVAHGDASIATVDILHQEEGPLSTAFEGRTPPTRKQRRCASHSSSTRMSGAFTSVG
jgi:hypothetical protein